MILAVLHRPILATVALLLTLCSLGRAQKPAAAPSVTIDSSVTVLESPQEPGAVQRATDDLLNDLAKVFGQAPRLVTRLQDAGPVTLLVAERSNLPTEVKCATAAEPEAFAFSIAAASGQGKAKRIVCLTGADMRGTIFAIYQFSQSYLGVDPMYLWTDKQPDRRASITLSSDFAQTFPKPVVRYRGFFINDEDLLTGWAPPSKGEQTGISLKVWDNIYETILRLKGNLVSPGTWIFSDDAQVYAATERGLVVTQHQATVLGLNVARWPKDVPYNFSTHPEILKRAWANSVAAYKPDQEILWTIGLRGLSDQSYEVLDPTVHNNDPLLGKRVSDAMTEQMRIVREKYPNAQFVTNLWQEGTRLMQEGYLKIPPEVTVVWADTGYGDMQDGGKVLAGQGMYYHVAMMNNQANQLTEMVPVARTQSELGRYFKAGATSYLLLNTSDIRPVSMTTRAVMELAWGGAAKETSDADGAFYRRWATEEFGAKSANEMAEIYKQYFAAPALRPAFNPPGLTSAGSIPPVLHDDFAREEGDQHYHTEARRLILDALSGHQVIAVPSQSPKWTLPRLMPGLDASTEPVALEQDIKECEAAQSRWNAVWDRAIAAERLIDPSRRDFYQASVLTMITINREGNRMLLLVASALQDANAGHIEKARNETAEALNALDTMQQSMKAAEYGKWKNWYRGDWLAAASRTLQLVQSYADHLEDPLASLPPPVTWTGWEAYFHIMEYEGDRSVDIR